VAGPFDDPPFSDFVVSPLSVVPKKEPGKFRIIHDLSFPPDASVNDFIDPAEARVHYESFDHLVAIVQNVGKGALMAGKSGYRRRLPANPTF
jgi:hypothetical protein